MPHAHYRETIARIGDLHANMAVLAKLDATLKDADSSLGDAERLIQTDGALSGAIIRISNSASYGHGPKCESIRAALQKVGYREVLKLVSLALSKQVFMKDLKAYGITADEYWGYSYFSALFMEDQAREVGLPSSDAYLVGLLHSIGRVLINELLRATEVEVFWDHLLAPSQWETAMVGFSSEAGGAELLQSWQFPGSIWQRIAAQSSADAAKKDPLLALLHYTRQLAIHRHDPSKVEALCSPHAHLYVTWSKRRAEDLMADVSRALARTAEVRAKLSERRS